MDTKALTLYSVEEELLALLDTEEMVEGEDERYAILNEIAEANHAAVAKRDNVIRFLNHVDHQVAGIKVEQDRLARLKKTYENGKKRFEDYIVKVIEEFAPPAKRGSPKLEGSIGVLSIAKKPATVQVDDPTLLPYPLLDVDVRIDGETFKEIRVVLGLAGADGIVAELTRQATYIPKKIEIKRAIQAGQIIPGADIKFGGNRLVVK